VLGSRLLSVRADFVGDENSDFDLIFLLVLDDGDDIESLGHLLSSTTCEMIFVLIYICGNVVV
jgi:hypothetical protein